MGAHRKNPPKDAAKTIEELALHGHSIIGIAKKLGVSKPTFQRWCEDDEALQEAFEVGRDGHRQALVALIMRDAVAGKAANANSMFLLKTMHQFREVDSPNTKVNVGIAVATPVMVVRDHGDDATWEARMAEQQRALLMDAASPPQIAPTPVQAANALPAPSYAPATPPPSTYDAPSWRANT